MNSDSPVTPSSPDGVPSGGPAILIVEDEEFLRVAIAKGLHKRGFLVLEARDGTQAIRLISDHQGEIAVMLLDISLPGASSRDVFLKAQDLRPKMEIIVTSAHPRRAAESHLEGLQFTHFLRKPYSISHLAGLISSL